VFFANLTIVELAVLFTAVAGVTVALYLLSFAHKQVRVSTLRFWQAAKRSAERRKRKRIDEPWSLLMQLLALACLLLAVSQPRWGSPESGGRDHVLLLDTSAWMAARSGAGTLSIEAQRKSVEWLKTLPAEDRVMVVQAGPVASPATSFESSHGNLETAIRAARPGSGALDIGQAFDLATQALRLQARRPGEIVYAGAGRVNEARPETIAAPANLRVLPLTGVTRNVGLVRFWMKRAEDAATGWRAFVTARNDSPVRQSVPIIFATGGAVVGTRMLDLAPGAEATASFVLNTHSAAWVEARLGTRDAFPQDNRAVLEVPAQPTLRIAVYTNEPEVLKPLLEADPRNQAVYYTPSQYKPDVDAGLIVIDRFAPSAPPARPSLWIEPPPGAGPIASRRFTTPLALTAWNTNHPLGAGLHTRDLKLESGVFFFPESGDLTIAEAEGKPLIAARPGSIKSAVLGYHPGRKAFRYELAAPLLMANLFAWYAPEVYLRREVLAGAPGAISVELDEPVSSGSVRVLNSGGQPLPFTVDGSAVRFFAAEPDTIRVIAGSTEQTYSISLPDAGRSQWTPSAGVKSGTGQRRQSVAGPRDLWPWFALAGVALLLAEWWIYGRKRARAGRQRNLMAALKAAAALAALIALMEPSIPVNEKKMAVTVVADASSSVGDQDLSRSASMLRSLQDRRGRNEVRLLSFARHLQQPASDAGVRTDLARAAGEEGRATNIEGALREAMTVLPSGLVPRIVLLSDGRETLGSAARAAHQARQLGIPVDTVLLDGRPEPELKLTSLRIPAVAFTGEKLPIELIVESPRSTRATLEILAEGRSLGQSPIDLQEGSNALHVTGSIVTPGAISVTGILRAGDLGELRFEQALALRRPRVLYLTQDPPGLDSHFMGVLRSAQFDVVAAADLRKPALEDFQLVVFNNFDQETLPLPTKAALERFVQRGGGVLVIGGGHNLYVDKKGRPADPLDRAMPATVAPPRSPEGTSLILIVDKSSSMEGRKMELARLAAIGVVENLRPIDYVGVLIFDNSHQWAVPLRRAEDKTMIKRLIAGITPDGGTQIAPALAESYRRMATATGAYKHIVLLTDGISEEGDSISLAKEAAEKRVTISTVGLGQDVNRTYLEKVAVAAKGKSYFLTDPSGLEQILIKDVQEHTGSTAVEKTLSLKVVEKAELFRDLALEQAPALKGYIRFDAKKDADTLLSVPGEGPWDDPLLVRWQYGLGRAAVFTSDAKARWAEGWVAWNGFDKFWANVLRDLLPHAQSGEATLTHDAVNGSLVAEYRLAAHVASPAGPPTLYVLGPGGFQRPVKVERAGEGYYRAVVPIGTRQGLFRVRPLADSAAFPETGVYIPEMEMSNYGNNAQLMKQIAEFTGGVFNPNPRDVFSTGGRSVPSALNLWPGLLALALLLNLAEVAWRKLKRS
jgi:uncharacterized membrane protein